MSKGQDSRGFLSTQMDPPRKSYFRLLLSNKTMPALVGSFAWEGKDQVKILCQGQHRVHRDNQAGRKFLEHFVHLRARDSYSKISAFHPHLDSKDAGLDVCGESYLVVGSERVLTLQSLF